MRKPAFIPASRLYNVESQTPIAHPAHQATDKEVRQAVENREIRTDGGRSSSDTEQPACTDITCDGKAEYAYWMPDLGDFSRVHEPERADLSDGDLCPYVCEACRDWRLSNGRYDADQFVDPREKLVADGGRDMPDTDRADELLRAAITGAARCLSHGHRFDDTSREPVVVKRPGGNLEVFCRGCAEHYGENIVRSLRTDTDHEGGDSR